MRADPDDDQRASRRLLGRVHTPQTEAAPAVDVVRAEHVDVVERLVISPLTGMFFPAFTDVSPIHPGIVVVGDEIGVVVQTGEKHPIVSPFTGRLMGLLAMPGERVRIHQPVAWLSLLSGD